MLVSVIIPVYNAEKYLEECIDSVLKQDLEDFEIILVNDGSTDSSGDICNLYAAKDNRIKVFHKTNGGVSSARNLGIENAQGEWITFIDSDDSIQENYFVAIAKDIDSDLVMQGFDYFEKHQKVKEFKYTVHCFSKVELINQLQLYPDLSSSCAKFFRREVVNKHSLRFNEKLKFGEDSIFTLQYLLLCKKIKTTDTSRYSYRLSDSGLTNTKLNLEHDKLFYEKIKNTLLEFGNRKFYDASIEIPLTRFLASLYADKVINSKERRGFLQNEIEENYTIIFNIYSNPKIKIFIKTAHFTGNYFLLDFLLKKLNRT